MKKENQEVQWLFCNISDESVMLQELQLNSSFISKNPLLFLIGMIQGMRGSGGKQCQSTLNKAFSANPHDKSRTNIMKNQNSSLQTITIAARANIMRGLSYDSIILLALS